MLIHSRKNLILVSFFLVYGLKLDPVFGFKVAQKNQKNGSSEETEETPVIRTENFSDEIKGETARYLDDISSIHPHSLRNKKNVSEEDSEEMEERTKILETPESEEIQNQPSTNKKSQSVGVRIKSEEYIDDDSNYLQHSNLRKGSVNNSSESEEKANTNKLLKIKLQSLDEKELNIKQAKNTRREMVHENAKLSDKKIDGSSRTIPNVDPPAWLPIDNRNYSTKVTGRRIVNTGYPSPITQQSSQFQNGRPPFGNPAYNNPPGLIPFPPAWPPEDLHKGITFWPGNVQVGNISPPPVFKQEDLHKGITFWPGNILGGVIRVPPGYPPGNFQPGAQGTYSNPGANYPNYGSQIGGRPIGNYPNNPNPGISVRSLAYRRLDHGTQNDREVPALIMPQTSGRKQILENSLMGTLNLGSHWLDNLLQHHNGPSPVVYVVVPKEPTPKNDFNQYLISSLTSAITPRPKPRETKIEPEMEYLHYDTIIRSRYATTTVTGKLTNWGRARDINVNVILPHRALITQFQTYVNGDMTVAVVGGINQTLCSSTTSPIIGENIGTILVETRDCDAITVSVRIPEDGTLYYIVVYEHLLERNLGIYTVPITIHTNSWIEDLMVRWRIEEERNITTLRIPSIHKTTALPVNGSENPMVSVTKDNSGKADIVWRPTIAEQKNISQELGQPNIPGMAGVLEINYDIERDQDPCGQLVRQDEFFVQFFVPPKDQPPLAKHVVFVLDVSGSMLGDPIRQLREAMLYILDLLQPADHFTIVCFSEVVNIINIYDRTRDITYRGVGEGPDGGSKTAPQTPWPGYLEAYQATPSNINAAKEAVKLLQPLAWTNIYDALMMGFKAIRDISALPPTQSGQARPEPFMVFLTDGQANDGPSHDHDVMVKMVEDQNRIGKATMYAIGFGTDADMKLLKRFALATKGMEKFIQKDLDATQQLIHFFESIQSPILKDAFFKYNPQQVFTNTLTGQSFPMIYRGKEVTIAGRLDPNYPDKLSLHVVGTATGRDAVIRCERYLEGIQKGRRYIPEYGTRRGFFTGTPERIWAFLTLDQLKDKIEEDPVQMYQNTRCDDFRSPIDRMLELSLRLNFAVPKVTCLVYNNTVIERISPSVQVVSANVGKR